MENRPEVLYGSLISITLTHRTPSVVVVIIIIEWPAVGREERRAKEFWLLQGL